MDFHYPKNVGEAVKLLEKQGGIAVAGGTAFVAGPRAEHLVDLTSLGLNYVKKKGTEVLVGATTTIAELEESPAVEPIASGIIRAACRQLADTPLRNMITVGGNLACMHFWANLPPVMMVLEASVKLSGKRERIIPSEELFKTGLLKGEFISEIIIPKNQDRGKGEFVKFSRTKNDYSLITIAAYSELSGGNVSNLRVAASGLCRPTRLKDLERELNGKRLTPDLLDHAVELEASEIKMLKSFVYSEEYKREILGTLLKRAIEKVAG